MEIHMEKTQIIFINHLVAQLFYYILKRMGKIL